MRFEGTARAHSLGKDGRWLDDNQGAILHEEWAGGVGVGTRAGVRLASVEPGGAVSLSATGR